MKKNRNFAFANIGKILDIIGRFNKNRAYWFIVFSRKEMKIMTKLSVNINKIAVVRNSRGGNIPNLLKAALDIERFGADGITVHPRSTKSITWEDNT